jgi:hypothetical protein
MLWAQSQVPGSSGEPIMQALENFCAKTERKPSVGLCPPKKYASDPGGHFLVCFCDSPGQ